MFKKAMFGTSLGLLVLSVVNILLFASQGDYRGALIASLVTLYLSHACVVMQKEGWY